MVMGAINQVSFVQSFLSFLPIVQLLNDTKWDELDILVIDLPPGVPLISQLISCKQFPIVVISSILFSISVFIAGLFLSFPPTEQEGYDRIK